MNKDSQFVKKNEEYIMDIISEGYEGEGVAKIENYPIFIKGAIIGEKVKVKIIKVNNKYAFGKIEEIIVKSPSRENTKCKISKRCGGCTLQHMNYNAQLDFKYRRVKDCISRIGGLNDNIVKYPIGMKENPFEYRNKVQLPIGIVKGKVSIGFFENRSHNIIDMDECIIQNRVANEICNITRQWIIKHNISTFKIDVVYNEKGILRHLMIRSSKDLSEIMVVLVSECRNIPYIDEYIDELKMKIKGLKSVIININNKNTNVILGNECITVYGKDTIQDYIGDFKFNISPLSFFQVNPVQTEVLYNKALEFAKLTGNEKVIDAYCGTGTISLFLSKKSKEVYGIEIIEPAILNAKENAKINNVNNAEFFVGKSEEVIPDLINKGIIPDVIVVDPPRKGCDKKLLDSIIKSNIKKIVYVSCDPATLARDLKILSQKKYEVKEVQPVDMFPQTKHVETVCLLSRKAPV